MKPSDPPGELAQLWARNRELQAEKVQLQAHAEALRQERLRPQAGQEPPVCQEEPEDVPARLIVRRTLRPKHACRCGCGGVQVAPLPPRLMPQSKLGLGLAVHLLSAGFDDHVAYHTLERVSRERHEVVIPRQQLVQWVEPMAFLLPPLCRARRKFRRLHRIEAQARDLMAQERQQVRRQEAAPIWTQPLQDAQALQPQLLPESSLGKAVSYFIKEYAALIGHLKSGTYMIDIIWFMPRAGNRDRPHDHLRLPRRGAASFNKRMDMNRRPELQFRCAGFFGRWIRCQRPFPAAVGDPYRS